MASYLEKANNYGGSDMSLACGVTKNASATMFIVYCHAVGSAGLSLSSPAYSGGGTVSLVGYIQNSNVVTYVYKVANPTGNGTFSVTGSNNSYWEVCVVQLSNCSYVSPTTNTGTGSGTSSGATSMTVPSGGIAIDGMTMTFNDGGGLAASGGWTTILAAGRYTTITDITVYNATAGLQSNTFTWTGTESWARIMVLAMTSEPINLQGNLSPMWFM